ncbi:M48 family metalloprotease [Hymenobacter sp. UYCo722]|uniref:M48 family metalloprotease n=1 Tax=Hymenobacter sp. UYCo722 TaxID=3156335 RepID=UPI003391F332
MFRFLCLALLGWLSITAASAQDEAYRPFYSPDTLQRHELAVAQRSALRAEMPVPKAGSSEYRAHYGRVVQEASADVYNAIRYAALLDPVVEPYVHQVFARILRANPQLTAGTRLVLTRNPEPNARAVGRSTVLLNLGLLPRLENESQLAYVLCHELAHGASHHLETGLHDRLTAIHSKELRREFRRIVNSEYNISSQLKALALGFSLSSSYHHRRFERQADSLGYVLLARTSYEAPQAYRTLQLLDVIDQPENPAPLPLAAQFSCTQFPRAFGAAAAPASIFTVQAAAKTVLETSDTLKSHPDCGKRMRFVQGLSQGRVAEGPQPPSPPDFDRIRRLSRLELVQSWFDYDCYDHALFEALQLLPQQPQSGYLRAMVQLSLFELRQHLQAHTFSEVVSNVSERQAANFNELLRTLHELRTDDFRELSTCFARAAPPVEAPAAADEFALAGRYAAAALAAPPTDPAVLALRDDYRRRYPRGRFAALLPVPPAPRATGRR